MSGLSERESQDFAVTVAALLAGRIDGAQAVATMTAQVEAIVARHVTEALTEAAEDFRVNAADQWGGDRSWFTTGTHVANLAAGWLVQFAEDRNLADTP